MAQIFNFKSAQRNDGPGKVSAAATAVRPANGGHRFVGKAFVRGVLYFSAGLLAFSAFIGGLAR